MTGWPPLARPDEDEMSRNWNERIADVIAGRWKDPETGQPASVPFRTILIEEDLAGREAELVAAMALGDTVSVVADANTWDVLGKRVRDALRGRMAVRELVLPSDIGCDEPTIARISDETRGAQGVIAVGSGSLQDAVKYATFQDGRPFCTFGTAASMNGYAATTASVTLASGLKTSLPAHAPRGVFLDLKVSAAAPAWLSAAGLGDSLCRPAAQVDWWFSHRMLGTLYSHTPYALQEGEEQPMLDSAAGLGTHDVTANGILQRVLTLCGLGVCFTHVSHHGSMGEHSISHWIDMFAGAAHPGSHHGTQVGVASVTLSRLQHMILAMPESPRIRATKVDEAGMIARYGAELAPLCIAEFRKKAMDAAAAEAFNRKLADLWPALQAELRPMLLPVDSMTDALAAAGGPVTASAMGLEPKIYRRAIKYAREVRNRYSFLDLADDAGLLDAFIESEV
jgi:glycerol-1-phosphate dehydrogenase [NAD(P)+]